MDFFLLFFLAFFVGAIGIHLLGAFGMFLFRFKPLPSLDASKPLPGVSVLKPCFNNRDNEEENFDHFFLQNYPGQIEIIFVVASEKDPIVPTIRRYLALYPKADAKLLVSTTRRAHWNKVNGLHDAQKLSKHAIILWSDSDVVVKPSYVSQMVACLQEPGVSLVTTPQYDFRANGFPSGLKTIANNCDDATFIMAYNLVVRKKTVAIGHSIGFKRAEFVEFEQEAWDVLFRHLADDLALPQVFAKHGKRVVFRNIYCPVQFSNKTLSDVIVQKRRFVICQKMAIGNRFVYLMGMLFYPEVPALGLILVSGFGSVPVLLFLAGACLRICIAGMFEWLFLGSIRMTARYFWTVPIWDLMQIGFFLDGFFTNSIALGGRTFRIVDRYFLEEIPHNRGKNTVTGKGNPE